MKYALVIFGIIALPFLTAIVLVAIPFATLYAIFQLFKKQPEREKKREPSLFDFLIENRNNHANIFQRIKTDSKPRGSAP